MQSPDRPGIPPHPPNPIVHHHQNPLLARLPRRHVGKPLTATLNRLQRPRQLLRQEHPRPGIYPLDRKYKIAIPLPSSPKKKKRS